MEKLKMHHTHILGLAWMVIRLPLEIKCVWQLLGLPPSSLFYDMTFLTRPWLSMFMQNCICQKARIADSEALKLISTCSPWLQKSPELAGYYFRVFRIQLVHKLQNL